MVARRVPAYGFVYPFIELALGVAYVTGFQPIATNLITLVVMSVSSIGVIKSVAPSERSAARVWAPCSTFPCPP